MAPVPFVGSTTRTCGLRKIALPHNAIYFDDGEKSGLAGKASPKADGRCSPPSGFPSQARSTCRPTARYAEEPRRGRSGRADSRIHPRLRATGPSPRGPRRSRHGIPIGGIGSRRRGPRAGLEAGGPLHGAPRRSPRRVRRRPPRASQKEIPIRRVTSSVESQEIVVQTAGQIDGLSCGRLEPVPIEPQ